MEVNVIPWVCRLWLCCLDIYGCQSVFLNYFNTYDEHKIFTTKKNKELLRGETKEDKLHLFIYNTFKLYKYFLTQYF